MQGRQGDGDSAADVSKTAEVARLTAAVEGELGPVDVLVNNAGIGLIRGIDELTEEDFDVTIAVNLKSAFLCTQARRCPSCGRKSKWGRIVNISSGAARGGGRHRSALQRLEGRSWRG